MNEREQQILRKIAKALPNMDEFEKGYFLGTAEARVNGKKQKNAAAGKQPRKAG